MVVATPLGIYLYDSTSPREVAAYSVLSTATRHNVPNGNPRLLPNISLEAIPMIAAANTMRKNSICGELNPAASSGIENSGTNPNAADDKMAYNAPPRLFMACKNTINLLPKLQFWPIIVSL